MSGAAMYAAVQANAANDLVVRHAPLVKRIAYHLMGRLPDTVQIDDLVQSGMLGLLEAIRNYDANQGASFETYAGIRIRGAMLDELRRSDWTPRSVHRNARKVSESIREIENNLGRDAKDREVAEHMGIGIDEYNQILQDSLSCKTFSVEELQQTGEGVIEAVSASVGQPDKILVEQSFRRALAKAIDELPEREKLIISLYYDEELNLREIGKVLDISESRVSQICSQALLRLRARLADWREENDNGYVM